MIKFSAVGDIMLARNVGLNFSKSKNPVISEEVKNLITSSDYCFGNLESPFLKESKEEKDHLIFSADPNTVNEIKFFDFLSLANNHINDEYDKGIEQTLNVLNKNNISNNGVYLEEYEPFVKTIKGTKFFFVTCTDMMNNSLESSYKVPNVFDDFLLNEIKKCKNSGGATIVYAHMGQLFSRFPHPKVRRRCQEFIDYGADIVITVHPHVIGGIEYHDQKPIIYSLGDFIMDGNSDRRRRSNIFQFEWNNEDNKFENFRNNFTSTTSSLQTIISTNKQGQKSLNSWKTVGLILKNVKNLRIYEHLYKILYKKEILSHNFHTIKFLIKERGFVGFLKLVSKRSNEVKMMISWIILNKHKDTKDNDAIRPDRKKFTSNELS